MSLFILLGLELIVIIGNMASNDEGQGSGDWDDVYRATYDFLALPTSRPVLRLRPALRLKPASRPALRLRPALPRGAEPV